MNLWMKLDGIHVQKMPDSEVAEYLMTVRSILQHRRIFIFLLTEKSIQTDGK